MSSKHILIISYVFPPYPGVGGRRWAKFAKYLVRKGFKVHIISAANPFDHESLYEEDVKDPSIEITELSPEYPFNIIDTNPKNVFSKILYRFFLLWLKLKVKGNYYDRGVFWKVKMNSTAIDLINKHSIEDVIITAAPFSILSHGLEIQKTLPHINIMADLRDPWTWGSGYGFLSLSEERKNVEKENEKAVMKGYNKVFVPSLEMKSHLIGNYPTYASKFVLLPHAFDAEEIKQTELQKHQGIKLLLYGTLYDKLDDTFSSIARVLAANKNVKLDIYTESTRYKNIFERLPLDDSSFEYKVPLVPTLLFAEFANYDFILVIQPDFAKDHITTKIYEIIYSQMPLLLISPVGKLVTFIKNNKLGYTIDPAGIEEEMGKILALKKPAVAPFPEIKKFSFDVVTDVLISNLS